MKSLIFTSGRQLLFFMALFLMPCIFLLSVAQAVEIDHVVERTFFEDSGGKISFEVARRKQFIPYQGIFNKGYRHSIFWLRLKVVPGALVKPFSAENYSQSLVVRIRPSYLDDIRLYDPEFSNQPRVSGGMYGWEESGYRSLNHGFLIPAGNAPRYIWLRLETSSTNLIDVAVFGVEDAASLDHKQELLQGLYVSLLLLFLAWSISCWVSSPERVIAVFTLKLIVDILYVLSYFGYARLFLLDSVSAFQLHMATKVLIVSATAGGVWFYWHFLREFQPPWLGMRLLLGLVALLPLELALLAGGQAMWALKLNMWAVLLASLLIVMLALMAQAWRPQQSIAAPVIPRSMLSGFTVSLLITLAVSVLPGLGLVKAPSAALYGVAVNGGMSGIIMMLMLRFRAHKLEQQRAQALRQLALSKQQIAHERSQREEQGRFMAMLAHELRTSLSVLRLAFGFKSLSDEQRTRASRTIQDMNGVIERCLLAEKLTEDEITVASFPVDLVAELCQLQEQSPAAVRVFLQADELPLLQTDPQLVHAILSNLLDNACKYSLPGTAIHVHARCEINADRSGICVDVCNQPGVCGMPDPEQLFQKYYRSPGARQQTGSGLGLYLMRHMARLLGGDIHYQQEEAKVRFSLWLPC